MILIFSCQHSTSLKQRKLKRGHFFLCQRSGNTLSLERTSSQMRISIGMEEITRSAPESCVCQVTLLYFGFLPSERGSVQRPGTHRGAANCYTLPGQHVLLCLGQVRIWRWDVCIPGASHFFAKPGLHCKRSPCQFSFIKKILLSMPKNNIMEKDNHLTMFDHGPEEFGRIPQSSKVCIFFQFTGKGWMIYQWHENRKCIIL